MGDVLPVYTRWAGETRCDAWSAEWVLRDDLLSEGFDCLLLPLLPVAQVLQDARRGTSTRDGGTVWESSPPVHHTGSPGQNDTGEDAGCARGSARQAPRRRRRV